MDFAFTMRALLPGTCRLGDFSETNTPPVSRIKAHCLERNVP